MNIITRYLNRRAAEKTKAIIDRDAARVKRLAEIDREIEKAESDMFSRPCPFTQGGNCQRQCVHFKPGRGGMIGDPFGGEAWFYHHNPVCKLWKE